MKSGIFKRFFRNASINFWRALTIVILCFTLYCIVRSAWSIIELRLEISDLEEQRDAYRAVIGQDSTMLERLKYDEYLEEFARERFYMQGKGEQVFVFEEEQK